MADREVVLLLLLTFASYFFQGLLDPFIVHVDAWQASQQLADKGRILEFVICLTVAMFNQGTREEGQKGTV